MKKDLLAGSLILIIVVIGLIYIFSRNPSSSQTTPSSSPTSSSSQNQSSKDTANQGGTKTAALSAKEYLEKALTAYQEKNFSEALSYLAQSIAKTPSAEAYNLWGNILRDQGKRNEAKEKYQKAISLDSHWVAAYLNLAAIYQDENNFDAAKKTLEDGLSANPGNTDLQNALDILNLSPTNSG